MGRHAALVATVLNAALLISLCIIAAVDLDLADRLTREDAAIEWLQATLFAAAAMLAVDTGRGRWRAGGSPVFEVLIAALLTALIVGEVDLDRLVAGRKIISTRFLLDARVWSGWRVLALLVMTLPMVALALYALRRRGELLQAIRRAPTESSGRVLIAGLLIFGLTQLFEKPLGRIPGLPRYMVEEMLELVAAMCFGVALYARWQVHRTVKESSPGNEERRTRLR